MAKSVLIVILISVQNTFYKLTLHCSLFFVSQCCKGYSSHFVLVQYAVDMAIIQEQANLSQQIPLKLQVFLWHKCLKYGVMLLAMS